MQGANFNWGLFTRKHKFLTSIGVYSHKAQVSKVSIFRDPHLKLIPLGYQYYATALKRQNDLCKWYFLRKILFSGIFSITTQIMWSTKSKHSHVHDVILNSCKIHKVDACDVEFAFLNQFLKHSMPFLMNFNGQISFQNKQPWSNPEVALGRLLVSSACKLIFLIFRWQSSRLKRLIH